jgi:hypothetical protein
MFISNITGCFYLLELGRNKRIHKKLTDRVKSSASMWNNTSRCQAQQLFVRSQTKNVSVGLNVNLKHFFL